MTQTQRKHHHEKGPGSRPPLGPDQERFLSELVREIPNSPPDDIVKKVPDPLSAQHLIGLLPPKPDVIPLVVALKETFQGRDIAKAVKRFMFKLKQKGIAANGLLTDEENAASILKPIQKDPPLCYVGPVNGEGIRAVTLILHRGGWGLDVAFAVVSDRSGFQDFMFRTVNRRDVKKLKNQFAAEAGPFVDTSLSHAAAILEEAYQRHQTADTPVPSEYLELRSWLLDNTTLPVRPAVYEHIPEPPNSDGALTDLRVEALFEHPLLASWIVDLDAMKPYLEQILKVNDSPIFLTEGQKAARVMEIQEKCAAELFAAEERERLKRRLEEMGYLFFKLGEEETAKLALAAAAAAAQEAMVLKTNPVVQHLVNRIVALYMEAIREVGPERVLGKKTTSPIIVP